MIRALHNLARFEGQGGYLSSALMQVKIHARLSITFDICSREINVALIDVPTVGFGDEKLDFDLVVLIASSKVTHSHLSLLESNF